MPTFIHPALLWGLGTVAIPVLIHLINMMRHRRVEWAAMEFLLVSQKKHRTWIIFKQLLLLLMRMAAVAAVVLMLAQPRLRGQLSNLFGGTRIHHIVLLDDSFSMSDRWADTDAFSEAKKVVERIGGNAVRQDRLQSFTLLRFSRVPRAARPAEPDLLKQPVGSGFGDKLAAILAKIKVTQSAAGPLPALQAVARLLGDNDGSQRIFYLISDFRARQWNEPAELRKALSQLGEAGAEIHLIDCVDRARPNLAIVSLAPVEGIRAAGVPWSMEVAVENFGAALARQVSVTLGEDGHGRPAVTLAEIAPGKTAKERFEVRLAKAGMHQITARLESDAVESDNHRYAAIDLPADLPVLLIDGDDRARGAPLPEFGPGAGRSDSHRHPAADRNATLLEPETAGRFSGRQSGECRAAGFLGGRRLGEIRGRRRRRGVVPRRALDVKFFNDVLYRDGKGLFPVPLVGQRELPVDRLEPAPDVQIDGHFIFRVFAATQNALLQAVTVERYFAAPDGWRPPRNSSVRVAAHLRNGAPLVVGRQFGKGRVMAFLTTAAPTWNNWARNPSFVVAMQDLQAYLSERPGAASRGWSARRLCCNWTRRFISRRFASPRPRNRRRRQPPSTPFAAPTEC